ncbi:hypothetical protein GCM10010317_083530 [Streptomyces mirabilis]|nr:hypothetical protein GCM10010317_083530 [Streptomyces mirabilis]
MIAGTPGTESFARIPGDVNRTRGTVASRALGCDSRYGRPGSCAYCIGVKVTYGAASNELGPTSASGTGWRRLAQGDNPVLLLSAGIGVTAVLAMLHSLAHGHSARQVLVAARSEAVR